MILSTENNRKDDKVLKRLLSALEAAGLGQRGRGAKIAKDTGYSANQVSWMLSGKTPLNDRFLKLVCSVYHISEDWLRTGEEIEADLVKEKHEEYGKGYIAAVAAMMREMDADTQKDIFLSVQKEKLLRELLIERQQKKTG